MRRLLLGLAVLVGFAAPAGSAIEGRTWNGTASYVVSGFRLGMTGREGYETTYSYPFRYRGESTTVAFSTGDGDWTLDGPDFDSLGGSMALGTRTSYALAGDGDAVGAWIHDRVLALTVNVPMDVKGAFLFGPLRTSRDGTSVRASVTILFNADGPYSEYFGQPEDVIFGKARIRLRATEP